MDIHRARFVPYSPSAISAVAFTRPTDEPEPTTTLKLALGRVNGDVEIWDPCDGAWVQECLFPGESKSIDALVWTREPDDRDAEGNLLRGAYRLFSTTASPAVTEWDLAEGWVKRRSTGNFGEVWCVAAQPRDAENKETQEMVVGCEDGSLVLLSTEENDLQFKRTLARASGKKAKCISVAYQTRERLVAGFANSTIRIYDTKKGMNIRNMSLGAGLQGAPKDVLVWKVKCLPNGDIVSGDSNGNLCIWDGKTYAFVQRIKGHETDTVELVTNADGTTIFSGSLGGKVAVYHKTLNPNGRQSWSRAQQRKIHHGDLKSMATYDGENLSVVVSGGSDIVPTLLPLRGFGKDPLHRLPGLPSQPHVTSARRARLLVSWWDHSIWIWRINHQPEAELAVETESPRKLVAKLELKTDERIRSVSISDDGKFLAAATTSHVKMFQLRRRVDQDQLGIRKIEPPKDAAASGAQLVQCSPDGKWLTIVRLDGEVQILRVSFDPSRPKYLHVLDRVVDLDRHHRQTSKQSGFTSYDRKITRIAFSPDSHVLAVADLSGYIDTWVLAGNEDLTAPAIEIDDQSSAHASSDSSDSDSDSSGDDEGTTIFYGQHWTWNPTGHLIPKLDSAPLVFSFRPSKSPSPQSALTNGNPGIHPTRHHPHAHSRQLPQGPYYLWTLTARHDMYEFDVLAGGLSAWSKDNPTSALPNEFSTLSDRALGALWDVTPDHERVWLYSHSWICMLNVADGGLAVAESREVYRSKRHQRFRKRKNEEEAAEKERKRLKREGGEAMDTGRDEDADDQQQATVGAERAQDEQRKSHWITHKYRPILGVVPLEDGNEEGSEERFLEAVVVERPLT